MAEGISLENKSLEDLERDITCAICQEQYTEPKLLPCLHYYCKKCILKLATRTASNQPFSCPECRKKTTLPEDGVEGLKTAFFVHRMQSMYSNVERVHGKVEVKCEGCTDSQDKAEAFCRQCAVFICKECVKQHKKLKALASHEVDSLEDLKQGRVRDIIVEEPPTKKCPIHEEPLIIYCFDCATLICHHCTAKIHRDHNFEFSKVAAPTTRRTLLEKMEPIKERVAELTQAVGDIESTIQEVEDQGNSVTETIQSSFRKLQQIIEKRKNELLKEAINIIQQKKEKLSAQKKTLSIAKDELQSIVDHTERFVGQCSDNEVMSMLREISSRIQQDTEEHSKTQQCLVPAEEADMGVEVICNQVLQQMCRTKAKVIRLPVDPVQCTMEGSGMKSTKVNETAMIKLTTRLSNSKITRRKVAINSQLRSLYNRSVVKCKVDQSEPGVYRIQYTPTVRGRHKLTVTVDGKHIAGSPFPIFVSIPPAKLGRCLKVWEDVYCSRGIINNSVNDTIVTPSYDGIVKLNKNKQVNFIVEWSQTEMVEFRKLAIDEVDNLYCTTSYSNIILRCNKDGGSIKEYKVEQVDGPGHWGITIVRDEVFVCERSNEGAIMVYNKKFRFARRIQHCNKGSYYDISADSHGNLYVTEPDHSYIRVFNVKGTILHSFNLNSKRITRLKEPRGICISGQYLYVTDWDRHCVIVVTKEGKYVTSFGRKGDKAGEFCYPVGVAVDKDGFVYVADNSNPRVHCF